MENNILDKGFYECTGCSACAIACPFDAIKIELSIEGFYEPILDDEKCTHCGLCKEVCYKYLSDKDINPGEVYKEKKIVAVLNNFTEQLHTVATAGIATKLAKQFFLNNYYVCGVSFNPQEDVCKHFILKSENDIERAKGSKYLQSYCYSAFSELFKEKKKTIVFGLPCQIFGLRKLIRQKGIEDQFVLVDFYCAGVPTLNLWVQYKDFISRIFSLGELETVNFRDKTQGWHKFSIELKDKNGQKYRQNLYNDMFYSFYLKKVCLNKPCYDCQLRHNLISSDIRLGDFWGRKYQKFDDGVELMVIITKKGEETWESIKNAFRYEYAEIKDVLASQKFNKMPIPIVYDGVIDALSKKEKLEVIHSKYDINNKGYK